MLEIQIKRFKGTTEGKWRPLTLHLFVHYCTQVSDMLRVSYPKRDGKDEPTDV